MGSRNLALLDKPVPKPYENNVDLAAESAAAHGTRSRILKPMREADRLRISFLLASKFEKSTARHVLNSAA